MEGLADGFRELEKIGKNDHFPLLTASYCVVTECQGGGLEFADQESYNQGRKVPLDLKRQEKRESDMGKATICW